jgi:hypothetical protein
MPVTQTVAQNLRPSPQFLAPTAVDLGPPIGKTWYDSLQVKGTKSFSHGLTMQASFVWAKGLVNGTGAEAGNITTLAGIPIYNDIYNYGINKQLNQLVRPLAAVISGSYTTPGLMTDNRGGKVLSQVVKDWQLGGYSVTRAGLSSRLPTPTISSTFSWIARLRPSGTMFPA